MSKTVDAAAGSNDSTMNLLRLFEAQPHHHVITRQDLTRDYEKSHPGPLSSDGGTTTINHYYTWNSSSTNTSIHKEKAAIIAMLNAVKSSSSSPGSFPSPSKSFTRSHRVQDIVSMCSEERCSFSADDHVATAMAVGSDVDDDEDDDDDADNAAGGTAGRRPLFDRVSRCWSCDDRDDDDGTSSATAAAAAADRRRRRPSSHVPQETARAATKRRALLIRLTQFNKETGSGPKRT